jgi:hypothetical protein
MFTTPKTSSNTPAPAANAVPAAASHTGAPRIQKAGKPRRRWILAALMTPPLVTVLSLAGASAASASNPEMVTGYGPTISYGGISYTGSYTAEVSCDAKTRTMDVNATNYPAWDNEKVYIQIWLYSWQTHQWYPGWQYTAAPFQRGGLPIDVPLTEPAGWYSVHMVFGWLTTAGWQTTMVPINIYRQYGTSVGTSGVLSDNACYA